MITVTQGDAYIGSRSLIVTVTDEDGARVDLTGTTLRFMVKRKRTDDDDDALISRATGAGLGITLRAQTGDTEGQALIALTSAQTNVPAGAHFYELEATDAIGIITLAAGRFVVEADLIQGA